MSATEGNPAEDSGFSPRVLIAEDSALMAETVSEILRGGGYRVAVALTASDALDAIKSMPVDVGLIDLHLPDGSGLDIAVALLTTHSEARAVLFSDHDHLDQVERLEMALRARISYLLKSNVGSREAFKKAFRTAHNFSVIDHDLTPAGAINPVELLSPRQLAVLELMAEGYSNRSIASRLGLSTKTVEFYAAQIYASLGTSGDDDRHPRVTAIQHLRNRPRLPA